MATVDRGKMEYDLQSIWPEWQLDKKLGKGSFGTVYKAVRRDSNVTSYAAIKLISIPQDPDELDSLRSTGLDKQDSLTYLKEAVNECIREIQLMQELKGTQNVVSIEDYRVVEKPGGIGWDIYIRMELLTSFYEYICDRTLSEKEVIRLGLDICAALELCAARGIIHRDIKPSNILVNDKFEKHHFFKLGDFGIARTLTNVTSGLSMRRGTEFYMAPEVFNSMDYDARVDICSLGIVLYQLLNENRLPFVQDKKQLMSPTEKANALYRRVKGEALPPPSEASPDMAALVLKACAHNPDDRFRDAAEMREALLAVEHGLRKSTPPPEDPKDDLETADELFVADYLMMADDFSNTTDTKKKTWKIILAACLTGAVLLGGGAAITHMTNRDVLAAGMEEVQDEEKDTTPGAPGMIGISIKSLPYMTDYYTGDELKKAGLTVLAKYDDGSIETIPFSDVACSPTTLTEAGTQTVTVTYEGWETTFDVEVQTLEVTGIAVLSRPDRTSYYMDETLDPTGLTLALHYNNGIMDSIDAGFLCEPFTFTEPGIQPITVSYEGLEATFDVDIMAIEVDYLFLAEQPAKKVYFTGDPLDTEGLVLQVFYNKGHREELTEGFTCEPATFTKAGKQDVVVSYGGQTISYQVDVKAPSVKSISIEKMPEKTSYFTGEKLDAAGLTLKVQYENGKTESVTTGFGVSPNSFMTAGETNVTIRYHGKAVSYPITVQAIRKLEAKEILTVGCLAFIGDTYGRNDSGEPVYRDVRIPITRDDPYVFRNILCSWTDSPIDITGQTGTGTAYADYGWKASREGKTLWYKTDRQGEMNEYAFVLPDDPSLAGEQYIVIDHVKITFTLTYNGDYSTGTGWKMTEVSYTDLDTVPTSAAG